MIGITCIALITIEEESERMMHDLRISRSYLNSPHPNVGIERKRHQRMPPVDISLRRNALEREFHDDGWTTKLPIF